MGIAVCADQSIAYSSQSQAPASASPKTLSDALKILTWVVVFAIPLLALVLGLVRLKGGWDDAAITASFARTYADTGRLALTPVSAEVEGFSSVAWMLLLTLPRYLSHDPAAILAWMKILAALSFCLSLIVFQYIASRLLATKELANLCTILLALMVPAMRETVNGMEMNLYMLFLLCLVYLLTENRSGKRTWISCWVLSAAMILTRFEAPYLILFLAAGLLLAGRQRSCLHLTIAASFGFVCLEIWRYLRFRAWMPNTVYAKMRFPYSPPHAWLAQFQTRFAATCELLRVLQGILVVVLIVAIVNGVSKGFRIATPAWAHRPPTVALFVAGVTALNFACLPTLLSSAYQVEYRPYIILAVALTIISTFRVSFHRSTNSLERIVFLLALAGILFGIVFGRNWGYDGRMILACIPFLLLSTCLFLQRQMKSTNWRVAALCTCILVQLPLWMKGVKQAWQNVDLPSVSAIEKTGIDADILRRSVNRHRLSILLPDIGGSTLCCERLEVFDSALLANTFLAHHGYEVFDQYLQQTMPEVIESHGFWSDISHLYNSAVMNDYSLTVINGRRLLLRNDLYAEFKAKTGALETEGKQCTGTLQTSTSDEAFVKQKVRCLYVSISAENQ
ncbi:MAG TPA: hypothetical protein VFP59_14340 [Candidatus Angelobacter sp.]|nr:hypothetical protein [Candidatus Angelobacter sp.]